jgi:hypothetical protein
MIAVHTAQVTSSAGLHTLCEEHGNAHNIGRSSTAMSSYIQRNHVSDEKRNMLQMLTLRVCATWVGMAPDDVQHIHTAMQKMGHGGSKTEVSWERLDTSGGGDSRWLSTPINMPGGVFVLLREIFSLRFCSHATSAFKPCIFFCNCCSISLAGQCGWLLIANG